MKPFVATVMLLFLCLGCSTLTPAEKEFNKLKTDWPGWLTLKQASRRNPDKVEYLRVRDYTDTVFPNDDLLKFKNLKGLMVRGIRENSFRHPEFRPVEFKIDTTKLKELRSLEYLELWYLDFREFPVGLGVLENLKVLEVFFCGVTKLPPDLIKLKNLKLLLLPINNLSNLPVAISEMDSLEVINLSNNSFQNIPEVLFTATQLSKVYLYNGYGRPKKYADYFEVFGNDINFLLQRNNPNTLIDSAKLNFLYIEADNCEEISFVKDSLHRGTYKPKLDFSCRPCGNCGAFERWWNGETIFSFD